MNAAYMFVSTKELDGLKALDDEDALIEAIDAQERAKPENVLYIDNSWDAIHFLLTERCTAQPIEGNALSEAIVGVHWFNEEDEEAACIAYSTPEDCSRIYDAIASIRADELPLGLDVKALMKAKIYAADWISREFEAACEILMYDFSDLKALYAKAKEEGRAMVISFL